MGGDGTVLEVINTLLTRVQKEADLDYDQPTCKLKPLEIPIGIIPTGTCIFIKLQRPFSVIHIVCPYNTSYSFRVGNFFLLKIICTHFSDVHTT